jgi:cardiolipin synthase A/B
MHFKMLGPVVAQLQAAFLDNWIKTTGDVLHGEDYFAALTEVGTQQIHCKLLIFDEYMVSVGSTNFDMRSFELNDEASLNVYDSQFSRQMTDVFERDLKSPTLYTYAHWRSRGWLENAAEIVLIPIRSQL